MLVRRLLMSASATAMLGVAMVTAAPASAAPPAEEYDLILPGVCPGLDAEINSYLHFRRMEKVLPDGTIHYFLDIRGTVVNERTGTTVNVRAARRYTDNLTTDTTTFSGLQIQFTAPGMGVIHMNAGTLDSSLSDPFAITEQHGRWDGLFAGANPPAAVCDYLGG